MVHASHALVFVYTHVNLNEMNNKRNLKPLSDGSNLFLKYGELH
jgi:hypothetical protein